MKWLVILLIAVLALWLAGVRLPGLQSDGCPYAGTASCGCSRKSAGPRASEDLLTRF